MRKLITALLLALMVLYGLDTSQAENLKLRKHEKSTSAKKSKSSATPSSPTLTASTFIRMDSDYFVYKPNFEQNLVKLGFKKISYQKIYEGEGDYDDGGTKRTYETKYTLTRNGATTTVFIDDYYFNDATEITTRAVSLNLPNQSETERFIKSIKSLGFKKKTNSDTATAIYEYEDGVGICFKIRKNKILMYELPG